MDEQKIISDYARYFEPLKKMGEVPLPVTPTIENLGVSKAQLQSGYKQMKEEHFDGSFIDFLCLVSLRFVVWNGRSNPVDFILKHHDRYSWDVPNMLRLVIKKPEYFFKFANMKPDKIAFTTLTGLWFDLYHK